MATPHLAADDQLSTQDHDDLVMHLNIIAQDPGWPQDSVSAANAILSSPRYTPLAWERFFTEYFTDYVFTDRLANYLGYPVFYWFDDTVHFKLQTGLDAPLMLVNVDPDWETAITGPGTSFADDPPLREDLYNSEVMLTMIAMSPLIPAEARQTIFDHFSGLVNRYPNVLRKSVTLDRAAQPYFGLLRTQAYMALIAAAPSFSPVTKAQIAATLDLNGFFESIWNDHTCLFLENNLTDAHQRRFVLDYLESVPPQLHNLRSITINDFLGNTTPYQDRSYGISRPDGGVNVFGCRIGQYQENSFPSDVPPGMIDVYCVVVAHEVNHVVDAYTVNRNPTLAARKSALIDAAGSDHMNYLRSMIDDGYFVENPQEFFASISNQWFTESAKTVELGLVRFDAGWREPINQALFFAEVYSRGGDGTLFYTTDTAGSLTRQAVDLERDEHGHIDELAFGGQRYLFELDFAGDVLSYSVVPACVGDLDGDGDTDLADLARLLAAYRACVGEPDYDPAADLDESGCVDLSDLAALLADYGCGI